MRILKLTVFLLLVLQHDVVLRGILKGALEDVRDSNCHYLDVFKEYSKSVKLSIQVPKQRSSNLTFNILDLAQTYRMDKISQSFLRFRSQEFIQSARAKSIEEILAIIFSGSNMETQTDIDRDPHIVLRGTTFDWSIISDGVSRDHCTNSSMFTPTTFHSGVKNSIMSAPSLSKRDNS